MHSKVSTFDFLNKKPVLNSGAHLFVIADSFVETYFKNFLKLEKKFDLLTGNELTIQFLEERFLNLSFFSEDKPILILGSEGIKEKVIHYIIENHFDFSSGLIVFLAAKDNKHLAKLAKTEFIQAKTIEAPKFYEGPKILDQVLKENKFNLPPHFKEILIERLENTFEDFEQAISKLKLHYPDGLSVSLNKTQDFIELIEENKVDFFKLIDVLNQSQRRFFYILAKGDRDFDYFLQLAFFMQSHLQKATFKESIQAKPKLSQYDRQILETAKKYDHRELKKLEESFSEIEILAKKKSFELKQFIRLHCMP